MKTPEEIRLAVLKEFERLTSDVSVRTWVYPLWENKEHRPSVGVMRASYSGEIPVFGCVFFFKEFAVSDAILSGNPELALAIYRLLNLEAKEIEERAKGLVDALEEIAHPSNQAEVDSAHIYAAAALNQWKGGGNG